MNNFGVIELASTRTTSAPGWAYVPDTAIAAGSAGIQPANRKRARNPTGGGPSLSDLTARQEAKIRKEVEGLEKDGNKDNTIPLPVKSGRAPTKFTPNVRKVMQSQKTFANHLDDYLALQALTEANSAASKRPGGNKKDAAASTPKPSVSEDVAMSNATDLPPVLPPPYRDPPASLPGDNDALLMSRVPEMPSDDELRKLLSQPPLPYLEALGNLDETYPRRVFCEVCGYWGRVRCLKCGTRVCALDCLETHREECVTRYGI
ncbi:hypothetical protein C2857_004064 [Epichloe festucae Fl1]|uniref:HIT-type domain-containing protein n=1 Tax=Epichloe festucae (strain Fl1) TaxID=877507 RepID=A0A7S9KS68_EPIFF|nr:hypothetical protein C2857_004064 [Epichloe festucae Fl1]